jgi:hypothetical protein
MSCSGLEATTIRSAMLCRAHDAARQVRLDVIDAAVLEEHGAVGAGLGLDAAPRRGGREQEGSALHDDAL